MLTREQFLEEITKPCFYCNATRTSYFNATNDWEERFEYTGLDRVDSSLGYEMSNVVPCCKVCNMAKSNMTVEQFIDWAGKIVNNQEQIRSLWDWTRTE